MAVGAFYGRQVFNPWLTVFQIALLQTVFYFGYVFVLLVLDRTASIEVDILDQMFRYDHVHMDAASGFVSSIALFINSVVFVTFAAVYIVGRAKKCLDFVSTLFIIHFMISCFYGGFPRRFLWWILNVISLTAATLLSEFLCMRRELRDIPLSGLPVELNSVATQF
mmetsp:Transcript_8317/g.25007  ORF Transcript_8317/g.25007 Transcript_8317/m.25007 type:complete len:166 (-) Transcript_8317:109-606(-)|eukprot:CAMPEP_0198732042 /NCGR_PEP_ID=MMETSP1475-20131203/33493_1 /TAXON_ID= ORGANISM="Unidentified sp., Strain CCMP1999" /NCGR_SAMPLE_ID=MMETSP1475 /ASSEMBLY_ACC=CAM_ASM_001111 /LENGTH=165 /DNA_ID=CAMNT_0044495079 /DNA_START=187 /DNA_END=684 /DNA_ORIENTATION=-